MKSWPLTPTTLAVVTQSASLNGVWNVTADSTLALDAQPAVVSRSRPLYATAAPVALTTQPAGWTLTREGRVYVNPTASYVAMTAEGAVLRRRNYKSGNYRGRWPYPDGDRSTGSSPSRQGRGPDRSKERGQMRDNTGARRR